MKSQSENPLYADLSGSTLIEASAGTGKTYTIECLYLRLILEQGLTIPEILVVTFTQAATEELALRIRNAVKKALDSFEGSPPDEEFYQGLPDKYGKSPSRARLRLALAEYDQNAIFTIHGFCQRVLMENAFATNSVFDPALISDQTEYVMEAIQDYWRKNIHYRSPLFLAYLLNNKGSMHELQKWVLPLLNHLVLDLIPRVPPPETGLEEEEFSNSFDGARELWSAEKETITRLLITSSALNKRTYSSTRIKNALAAGEHFFTRTWPFPLMEEVLLLTWEKIQSSTKKDCTPPYHPFFQAMDQVKDTAQTLERSYGLAAIHLRTSLFDYLRREVELRKKAVNELGFDDLLMDTYAAVTGRKAKFCKTAVRRKYKAALIDEFQDTDPVQYTIFKEIFQAPNRIQVLIGDPKQSIYNFRGADVFAYLKAKKDTPDTLSLSKNWRSDPRLLQAVNLLFDETRRPLPFVLEDIGYVPVCSPSKGTVSTLTIEDDQDPLMQFLMLDHSGTDGGRMNKRDGIHAAAVCTSGEIARLLHKAEQNRAYWPHRPLQPADIAVLVRTNKEAWIMKEELTRRFIPAVVSSAESVFTSPEAGDMILLLRAAADPAGATALRSALATDLFGTDPAHLDLLQENSFAIEDIQARFKEYHHMWLESGFIRMVRYLLRKENIRAHLLSFPDGERRLTNILHLTELLHNRELETQPGMQGLIKWLAIQREEEFSGKDEYQLRLESDEHAVTIVTIHKSKGLEYPVLFCPFLFYGKGKLKKNDSVLFHDRDKGSLTLDLGSEDRDLNKNQTERENLAEDLRLLYVALTRARDRCYVCAGAVNGFESSALAYLLAPEVQNLESLAPLIHEVKNWDNAKIRHRLNSLASMSGSCIGVRDTLPSFPEPVQAEGYTTFALDCRQFQRRLDRRWTVTSFSGLTSGFKERGNLEWDEGVSQVPLQDREEESGNMFDYPRGPRAGTALHAILEKVDFSRVSSRKTSQLVDEQLSSHSISPEKHGPAVRTMLKNLAAIQLDPMTNMAFNTIGPENMLPEMEFYVPTQRLSADTIREVFATFDTPWSEDWYKRSRALTFEPQQGYLRGFIDLVFQYRQRFYLVDWKSNYLGGDINDYNRDSLTRSMVEHGYILQYHLYALALDRYLDLKVPEYSYEDHFGGVFYVFLRGIDIPSGPSRGFFFEKPAAGDMELLQKNFLQPSN